jgi:putative CocE/NonD family hydrolase
VSSRWRRAGAGPAFGSLVAVAATASATAAALLVPAGRALSSSTPAGGSGPQAAHSAPGAGSGAASAAGGTSAPGEAPTGQATCAPVYVTNCEDRITAYSETQNVPITMSDGTVLEADEYVPTTCTARSPCPVVLIQTPYRKGETVSPETIPYLYEHGYIEVVVDVRGTGSSEGYWDSFGGREQQDGAELAQWVADPAHIPASDGRVGLAGVSYSGINQLLTVEAIERDIRRAPGWSNPTGIRTDPVKAIFPVVAMSDAYRDVTFAGGDVDAGFIPLWLGLVNGLAVVPGDQTQDGTPADEQIALNAESQHLADLGMFMLPAVADATLGADEGDLPQALQSFPDQAYDGPFFEVRSPLSDIGDVHVPTFLVGGTYDLFQRGEPLNYDALALPPTEKKLLIGPWYHVTTGNGLTADDGSSPVTDTAGNVVPSLDNLELAWFDHWLKGTDNGITGFPTVESYHLGQDRFVPGAGYPDAGTRGQRWYLGPGGSLATAVHGTGQGQLPTVTVTGTCSRSTWQWTAGLPAEITEPAPLCENDSRPAELQGLTFTTAPFRSAYTVSGPIEADLYMSSTAADSTVVATVSDVSPSGTASDVTAGSLVASLRRVVPTGCRPDPAGALVVLGCSLYLDGQSIEPWHPYTRASQAPLPQDEIVELQIEVFPTAETFEPGHSMRLTITTSDVPHELQSLSTTTAALGIDTFYLGGEHPSSIYLGTTTPLEVHAG